jgi:hypothetical protein
MLRAYVLLPLLLLFHEGLAVVAPASLFLSGNVMEGDRKATEDNWKATAAFYFDRERLSAATPFPAHPSKTTLQP